MLFKVKGTDDDLCLYAEAGSAAEAKQKVEALTGYLKPQHIEITQIKPENLPDEENVL